MMWDWEEVVRSFVFFFVLFFQIEITDCADSKGGIFVLVLDPYPCPNCVLFSASVRLVGRGDKFVPSPVGICQFIRSDQGERENFLF